MGFHSSFLLASILVLRRGCSSGSDPRIQFGINVIRKVQDFLAYQEVHNLGVQTTKVTCLFPLDVLTHLEDRHLQNQSQWRDRGEGEGEGNSDVEEKEESRKKALSQADVLSG